MHFAMYSQLMDPTGQRIYADLMDELKEQATLCEEAGFHSVWVDEHHFLAGQNCSTNPTLPGSMLAAHTERVRIGMTNVVGCWQPLRLAEDVALLDHISRGRVEVGLGRGINPFDVANLNPHLKGVWPDPLARFDTQQQSASREHFAEFVEVLRTAWTEEYFSYQGTHYKLPYPGFPWRSPTPPGDPSAVRDGEVVKMCLGPKPYQKPHPRLWMLMSSEPSFTEAAKLRLNGLVWIQPPGKLRERLEIYRQIRSEGENRPFTVGQDIGALRMVYVANTYEEAKRDADSFFTPLYASSSRRRPPSYWFDGEEATAKSLDLDWEFFRKQLLILAGSPEQVIEQIEELREVSGIDHLLVWTETMGMEHRKVMSSLGLIAEKVAPAFAH